MHAMTVTARSTVTLQRSVEVGRLMTLRENTVLILEFPFAFVPSLSWQIIGFHFTFEEKKLKEVKIVLQLTQN